MLTAVYHFEVPGLWVAAELLGARETATFLGHEVTLVLPKDEIDFGLDAERSHDFATLGAYAQDKKGRRVAAEVLMIRVEVKVEGDLVRRADVPSLQASAHRARKK
jgi:hypothetical protein